ncbi:D-Ala-D-Ala carboxypeptidase family metallohydrolase [Hyphomicrobium sulfonivorans]|uniref:Uncharacterized protein n=1 Tax=Hyphomicrobium sulfonivorans TaxID=121290 RepID=A0A109B8T4_HYPSL|nr:D-Ala-D-Ala carboxypeptidase family metallohydrolase [Hyphomicrobium sulfonivorans]KWT64311.1 hypothetical protein APY04_3323 [Hyphomicrobium sulfonivorans]MBI1649468.1 hypothetical protein [Hyphomicrobium sulfonivorans]NSL71385.1 hypothetical protein [Hyphomicrobium sulfonivorans]
MIKRLSTAAICVALVSIHSAVAAPNPGSKTPKQANGTAEVKADPRTNAQSETKAVYGADVKPAEDKKPVKRLADARGAPRKCLSAPARALLDQIEEKFGPVRVISTCRPGARIAGSGRISRHASGNAVDFDAGSRKGAIVSWLVANHKSGGTMTYPSMSHIHVDIGRHFVSLAGGRSKTASRSSGKRSRYASSGSRYSDGEVYYGGSYSSRSTSYSGGSYYGNGSGTGRYSGGYATMY